MYGILIMIELLPQIRNAARALIFKQDKILLLRKVYEDRGERYTLPGGGQDTGENLQETLRRECLEEIGTSVEVDKLVHVADIFRLRDTQPLTRRHVVEFLFHCHIADDYLPHNGVNPDKHQVEVVWLDMKDLTKLTMSPNYLSDCINTIQNHRKDIYLGAFQDDSIF
jgi:8-oxo-dGTP pyrophosphatase MutT (NUDIX family)